MSGAVDVCSQCYSARTSQSASRDVVYCMRCRQHTGRDLISMELFGQFHQWAQEQAQAQTSTHQQMVQRWRTYLAQCWNDLRGTY